MASDFPSDWKLGVLADLAIINPNKKKGLHDDLHVSFISMENISTDGYITNQNIRPYSEVKTGYTSFQENDVIFAKITPCMENGKGALTRDLTNKIGFGSTEFHILRATGDNDPEFIYYYTIDKTFRLFAESKMTGSAGQQRVPTSVFYEYPVGIPERHEQQKIVQVLKTIDNTIEKTKELIEKHKMIKQGLMKDLFEEIILNGKKQNLKISSIFIRDGTHGSHEDVEDGIPLLSAKDVVDGNIILDNDPRKISKDDYDLIHRKYSIQTGDVLLTIVGTIGRTAIVGKLDKPFTVQRSVAIIRPRTEIYSEYLYYYFNTEKFQKDLLFCINASAQGGVYLNQLNDIEIFLPQTKKDQKIVFEKVLSIDKILQSEQKYLQKLIRILLH